VDVQDTELVGQHLNSSYVNAKNQLKMSDRFPEDGKDLAHQPDLVVVAIRQLIAAVR
jgi:hypothetical protein